MKAATRADRSHGQFFAPALLEARAALHLSYRLMVRILQFFGDDGAAAAGTGWFRVALPLFVVWDIVLWAILRRSDRFGLRWRLPIDALDMAFWSVSPHPLSGQIDSALLIAIPLAIEGAFRIGWRALVVPATGFVVPLAARLAAGRPAPKGFGVMWLLIGVGLGLGLYRYCSLLNAQAEAERERRRGADRSQAYLAGQNAVAMGASSVVDAIEGVVPILGRPERGSALWRLADGWKAELGSSTARRATYLQVALLEWERQHNRHPDLASHVWLSVAEGAGTVLLTGSQVQDLGLALSRLAPRGPVRVGLADPGASSRPPGRPLRLVVGEEVVEVPGDRARPRRPVDPGPVAFVFLAAYMAHDASRDFAAVPWTVVGSGMLMFLLAALWSHRQLVNHGLDARAGILCCAMLVGPPYTVAATLTMRNPILPGGGTGYVLATSLMALSFLLGGYHDILTRWLVAGAAASAIATCATAVLLQPASPSPRDLLIGITVGLTPYLPFRRISGALARASTEHAQAAREDDERFQLAAFNEGKADVLDLVRGAPDDARGQLASLAPSLEPEIAQAVSRRLRDVDERLAALA